jgi:hypothetical protein
MLLVNYVIIEHHILTSRAAFPSQKCSSSHCLNKQKQIFKNCGGVRKISNSIILRVGLTEIGQLVQNLLRTLTEVKYE